MTFMMHLLLPLFALDARVTTSDWFFLSSYCWQLCSLLFHVRPRHYVYSLPSCLSWLFLSLGKCSCFHLWEGLPSASSVQITWHEIHLLLQKVLQLFQHSLVVCPIHSFLVTSEVLNNLLKFVSNSQVVSFMFLRLSTMSSILRLHALAIIAMS